MPEHGTRPRAPRVGGAHHPCALLAQSAGSSPPSPAIPPASARTGAITGTPGRISPEYYRHGAAGPAGDFFDWGALVAYAATGRLPFGTGAPDAAGERCARLLAAQATQVTGGEPADEPTRVGVAAMAQWEVPTLDDPRWHAPARSSRRRTVAVVLVAAAVAGGGAGRSSATVA
ncbi:hypothetical protein [Streptomyces collinus]|uniref:hypothetical protein n=1 Tax=Streptomyces collinus TaxID=42684 RepID=UPI003626C8E6